MLISSRPVPPHGPGRPSDRVPFECKRRVDAWTQASLELRGELDGAVCREFEMGLAEAQRASADVLLDLHRLTFMDSAGYAVLLRAAQNLKPGSRIIITGCSGQVRRLLDLVGLPERVEVYSHPLEVADGA